MAGGGLQAVLFDMDGLLIDSEPMWLEVETEVMAWLGGEWGPQHQQKLLGGSVTYAAHYMLSLVEATVAPQEVERRLVDGMAERLAGSVPLMPGAKELLAEVRAAGVATALVSSSERRLVEAALAGIGREHFDVTVAGDEVARRKPDPEPYLTAMARLGVSPGRCVVLEDSPTGLAAAEAAGCVTLAVPGVVPVPPAPGRTVVESLRNVDLQMLNGLLP